MCKFVKIELTLIAQKLKLRSSQNLNLGLLNVKQMALTTEPLELWHWNRGFMASINSLICRLGLARSNQCCGLDILKVKGIGTAEQKGSG